MQNNSKNAYASSIMFKLTQYTVIPERKYYHFHSFKNKSTKNIRNKEQKKTGTKIVAC